MPQDPSDKPASELLKRLASEARSYAGQYGLQRPVLDSVLPGSQPFFLPDGWSWTRLAAVANFVTDGDHQPPPKTEQGVAFLTIGNVTTGRLDFTNCRYLSEEYFQTVAPYRRPVTGDILYTVVGATYGRPVIVDTDRPFCVQRHIAIIKTARAGNPDYLRCFLASPFGYAQATQGLTGIAQPTLPLRPLRNFLVPVPPIAEQRRIVARVDELMALCDQLGAQLTMARDQKRRLLEAVLHEALASAETEPAGAVRYT